MPVEIKELTIKASVGAPDTPRGALMLSALDLEKLKNEIVRECTEKILHELQLQSER
jgi:hypothetical protein